MRVRLKNIRLLNSKIVFLVALTVIGGCSTFQNNPSSRIEPQEPKETMQQLALQKPKETMQQLAPLLLEGTKPLLIDEQEDFLPSSKDMAEFQGISPSYVAKLFTQLQKAGIVQSVEGIL